MPPLPPERLKEMLSRPTESLNIELKTWISPGEPEGIAKIIKACFAIYNRNGGVLQIGFNDGTRQQDTANAPKDVRADFHQDVIQGLISKYASKRFEVDVQFENLNGHDHPFIVIPSGVRTIVTVRSDLFDSKNKNALLSVGDVYFRTLHTNGTASSAKALPADWEDILEICLDNREADIGRFLRRNLPDTTEKIREALLGNSVTNTMGQSAPLAPQTSPPAQPAALLWSAPQPAPTIAAPVSPLPTLSIQTSRLLEDGIKRFEAALKASANAPPYGPPKHGRWSTALVIEPTFADEIPTRDFLRKLEAANPNLTGWPVWLDSWTFPDEAYRPKVIDGAWQTLIFGLGGWAQHIEFHRLNPKGEFFLSRVHQDDLAENVPAGTVIDPILVIYRVTEAIAVGLAFAKALGAPVTVARLGFRFQWTDLASRELNTWANPLIIPMPGRLVAHDAIVEDFIEVPLDVAPAALAPYVHRATRKLFSTFNGTEIRSQIVEQHVSRLLERKF